MNWKQKVHQFSKGLRGVSIFLSIWVLLKFIFTLREYKKPVNQLKAIFFLIGIHSMQGWTATTKHGVIRERLKHPEKNIQLLGVCWF